MAGHAFHPSILREYDIRGVVGSTLGSADARALGGAFGTMLRRQSGSRVAVGQDGRLSSPELADALVEGLVAAGIRVSRVGLGPTPMLYFADRHLDTDGAIMVTGSHNPPEYNGFKMVLGHKAIYGEDIQTLGAIARAGDFAAGSGSAEDCPLLDAYAARLLEDAALAKPLAVAWDPGNGAAGPVVKRLCDALPGRHVLINEMVDGSFPAHHPDPTLPESLAQLQSIVRTGECDIGIAFDGDGDRLGVIDNKGRVLWGDQIMVFLARDVLRRNPGATVIADVKASEVLFEEVRRMGGNPLMWRTGHSLIKAKMAETGAPLAGEMSGHIFFADGYYGFDDAIYAALRLLNVLSRSPATLATLRDRLPRTINTPELRFPCPEERKFAVIDEVRARLEQARAEVNGVDGVRVRTPDGWWLLRASNTQDVLVARCEASTLAGLQRLKAALADQLALSALDPQQIDGLLERPEAEREWSSAVA
jgi:phosphomannomutase